MSKNDGKPSKIFLQAKDRSLAVGMQFDRLERTIRHNGTLAHFYTQVKGESRVLHYGYHSIYQLIEQQEQIANGISIEEQAYLYDEELEDVMEYEFSR